MEQLTGLNCHCNIYGNQGLSCPKGEDGFWHTNDLKCKGCIYLLDPNLKKTNKFIIMCHRMAGRTESNKMWDEFRQLQKLGR